MFGLVGASLAVPVSIPSGAAQSMYFTSKEKWGNVRKASPAAVSVYETHRNTLINHLRRNEDVMSQTLASTNPTNPHCSISANVVCRGSG